MEPPQIERLTPQLLLKRMKELVPYYTPEWKFKEDAGPGGALFSIFSEMYMQNVNRFNQVPLKNYITFLNYLNVKLKIGSSATSVVTFVASEGTKHSVEVPQGTQVIAVSPEDGKDVVFETEESIFVHPWTLSEAYHMNPSLDLIVNDSGRYAKGMLVNDVQLFYSVSTNNLQEHSLYMNHPDFLNSRQPVQIELTFPEAIDLDNQKVVCLKLADANNFNWTYYANNAWISFNEVTASGVKIVLKKTNHAPIEAAPFGNEPQYFKDNVPKRWIRCSTKINPDDSKTQLDKIWLSGIQLQTKSLDPEGLPADQLFCNDTEIIMSEEGFYPFSEYFVPGTSFYISSEEALSKKNCWIIIDLKLENKCNMLNLYDLPEVKWKLIMRQSDFTPPKPKQVSIKKVIWEYWNGHGWIHLAVENKQEQAFYQETEMLDPSKGGGEYEVHVQFQCPSDLTQTYVNSQWNYWIRVRIIHVENMYGINSNYVSPLIKQLQLHYDSRGLTSPLTQCLAVNNASVMDRTEHMLKEIMFQPFIPMDSYYPAYYLGFAAPPFSTDKISLFIKLKYQNYAPNQIPKMHWEYLNSEKNWHTLQVNDDTQSFTRSGIVEFIDLPKHMVKSNILGKELYWFRIVNQNQNTEQQSLPVLQGIYPNTVRVNQQESIQNEFLTKNASDQNAVYSLKRFPIHSAEIWVDETDHLTENDMRMIENSKIIEFRTFKDSKGKIRQMWIRWQEVDNFDCSGTMDRHYVINYANGTVYFGDGHNGKLPPNKGFDLIKANYKISSGNKGNVRENEINKMKRSIAYIKQVYNPIPSGGGSNMESMKEAKARGPQVLKHRNRAVTAEDFEWLAKIADSSVAKVKCLSNYNLNLEAEIGCVTLAVYSKFGREGSVFFPEMKCGIERYLMENAVSAVMCPDHIQVIETAYIAVCVTASLVLNRSRTEDIALTKQRIIEKLDDFLDPIAGNNGKGWNIGQQINVSVFYALFQLFPEIEYVSELMMSTEDEEGKAIVLDEDRISLPMHGIIVNGRHLVTIKQ